MPDDLYRVDLRTISGADLYRSIRDFTKIDRVADDRPREGYLLDFKEGLNDRFLRTVASFANTFGGLLILGVSEVDGRPDKLVGLTVPNELKTQVSNFIASNLFPCPPFEIAECSLPEDVGKKLCVVRVRETTEICLLAKKGESHPIYVRIEDASSPPDSSKLRALLDRKRYTASNRLPVEDRLDLFRENLYITVAGPHGPRTRSGTYFRLILYPNSCGPIPLDLAVERQFFMIIPYEYPGLQALSDAGRATVEFSRGRDWTAVCFRDLDFDYERLWRIGTNGEIALVTQTRWPVGGTDLWSINDIARDIATLAKLARSFWQDAGYYGGFRLDAELHVEGLTLACDTQGYSALFYSRLNAGGAHPLDRRLILFAPGRVTSARAEADLAYDAIEASLPDTIAAVVNELLRGLGHVADLQKLRQSLNF